MKFQAVSSVIVQKKKLSKKKGGDYKSTSISINYRAHVYNFQLPYQKYSTWLQNTNTFKWKDVKIIIII